MNLVKGHLNSIFNVTYSSIYRTPAEGFVGEDFFNSVCKFETDKDPYEIRSLLKQIEKNMGRTKEQKGMSSRVIDLDLILYGDLIINDEELELPSLDIEMDFDNKQAAKSDNIEDALNYKLVGKRITGYVKNSKFKLVEALAENISKIIL